MPTRPRRRHTTPRIDVLGEIAAEAARPPPPGRERVFPRPPQRWRPWFWLAAFLLHLLIIGALLLFVHPRPMQEAFEPTGVSVVFAPGEPSPTAPRAAPIPTPERAPPPAAPPPAPEAGEEQPEVNLNLPDEALAMPQLLPAPNTQPAPPAHTAAARSTARGARHARVPHYIVMNNMSVTHSASPPSTFADKDLNLEAGAAPASFASTSQISIQGDPGTNWEAIFNKWVNQHIYYPQAAAEQGQQGAATISFTVHRDGTVTGVRLLSSAGSPFLDQAWLGIFLQNNVPPFSPDAKDDTIHITATLDYVLEP